VHEALAICSAGALILVLGLVALQLTQPVPVDLLLFEAVSALGTVGLTAGATAKLDAVGKVIVMGLMFAGRVGPLSLLALLSEESDDAAATAPDGTLTIG
jgi:trk system potassium uptake protein TrkH